MPLTVAGTPSAESNAESIIAQHNLMAIQIYNQLKNKTIQKTDPLIIAWGNRLTFYHRHKIRDYFIVSEEYNELKGIAHVTLAVFALFNPLNEFPKNSEEVKAYQNSLVSTEKAIDGLSLSSQQKERQKKILRLTNTLLKDAMDKKVVSQQALNNFFSLISPLIMENINEATKIEITLLNQQMTKIQHQLTPEERNKLFVIIPVPKMPRQENIVGQYFSKYMNVPIETERLIYAEGLTDTQSVLSIVGTWQIESLLSASFFHDPDRMKKDLVSTNAKAYLQHCKVDRTNKVALVCS
jgi:hypothetical protein